MVDMMAGESRQRTTQVATSRPTVFGFFSTQGKAAELSRKWRAVDEAGSEQRSSRWAFCLERRAELNGLDGPLRRGRRAGESRTDRGSETSNRLGWYKYVIGRTITNRQEPER